MNADEQVLRFQRDEDTPLLGIAHVPETPSDIGVIVVVGGPQYRAGSHRQFVHLARGLAAEGFTVLRFDLSGMGDSGGTFPGFEGVSGDIGAAIDSLQREVPAVRRVVLWGLCDGASAALLYLDETHDVRVAGLCLANPWVRDPVTLARTQVKYYYGQRLMQAAFWKKLLTGQVGVAGALKGLLHAGSTALRSPRSSNVSTALPFQQRMARSWRTYRGSVLLILSGNDYTAKEFIEHAMSTPNPWSMPEDRVTRMPLEQADHTFSTLEAKHQVLQTVRGWLRSHTGTHRVQGNALTAWTAAPALAGALLLAFAPALGWASEAACGGLENAFGPFDYRKERGNSLHLVESAHFTPKVEALAGGTTGKLGGDIDYTLRAFPNHHRALMSVLRWSQRAKAPHLPDMRYPVECYFERALRFRPDDTVARVTYALYLLHLGRTQTANDELERASLSAKDNGFSHHNIGLAYFDAKNYARALESAHRAHALGFARHDLKEKLVSVGQWRDPDLAMESGSASRQSAGMPAAGAASATAAAASR